MAGLTIDAHRRVNVECEQNRGEWGADVGIGVRQNEYWWGGITVPVDLYDDSLGGDIVGKMSCDAADKWKQRLRDMTWWYNFPFHDCWTFAREIPSQMKATCP